jgi:hypothetical protein
MNFLKAACQCTKEWDATPVQEQQAMLDLLKSVVNFDHHLTLVKRDDGQYFISVTPKSKFEGTLDGKWLILATNESGLKANASGKGAKQIKNKKQVSVSKSLATTIGPKGPKVVLPTSPSLVTPSASFSQPSGLLKLKPGKSSISSGKEMKNTTISSGPPGERRMSLNL